MWYLIGEIAIYLVSGFFLGAGVGWFFRGAECKRNLDALHTYWTGRVKTLDRLNAATRQDLDLAGRRIEELDDTLSEKLAALEREAAAQEPVVGQDQGDRSAVPADPGALRRQIRRGPVEADFAQMLEPAVGGTVQRD